jgi:hypothetical protein
METPEKIYIPQHLAERMDARLDENDVEYIRSDIAKSEAEKLQKLMNDVSAWSDMQFGESQTLQKLIVFVELIVNIFALKKIEHDRVKG